MIHFLLPGSLARQTGGTYYDKRVVEGLRAAGRNVTVHQLPTRFPFPEPDDLAEADTVLSGLPDGSLTVVDGLAFGALPDVAAKHADRLRLVALVHHPLARETGLEPAAEEVLQESEWAALQSARRIVVTSPATREQLVADYGVTPDRISVVPPGTDPAPLADGSAGPELHLLCVGALIPRKGHDVLLEALAPLADRPWRLTLAGPDDHRPATAAAVRALVDDLGLDERVTITGSLTPEELSAAYDAADVFVLASHYEGFGMVLTEALARGLPIVSTTGGAIPATVPEDAALLAPPGDVAALGDALAAVLADHDLRARLRDGARAARKTLPDWTVTARRFATALENRP